MLRLAIPLLALCLWMGGCNQTAPPSNSSAPAEAAGGSTTSQTKPTETPAEEKPVVTENLSMPSEMAKRPDVVYSGLANLKERTYAVTMGEGEPQDGNVSVAITSVAGGAVMFNRKNGGVLDVTGTEKLELNEKGLFVVDMEPGSVDRPQMELPSDLKVGSTWTQKGTYVISGNSYTQDATLKALSTETVKVPAGEYKAIKISLSGTMNTGTIKNTIQATLWYAENVGLIKAETQLNPPSTEMRQTLVLKSIE